MAECFRPDYFKTLDEGLPSGGRLKPDGIYFDFDSTLDAFRVFIANREGTGAFPMVMPLYNEPLTIGEGLLGGSYDGSAPVTISANFGTGSGQIARGNHNHDGVYRPVSWTPTLDQVLTAGDTSSRPINLQGYGDRTFSFYDMNVYNGGHLGIIDGYPELKLGDATFRHENGAIEVSGRHLRTLNGDPSNANDLTRKAYVDSKTTLLASAGANTWFGNSTGSTGTPAHNNLSALTKTDDTNITLTLGGTPATALAKSVSMTLGWTGQLAISRGGTGLSAVGTSGQILRSNGTALEYFTHDFISSTLIGAANGIASLDASGKVPLAQLPVIGMQYMGEWDASTNSPALSNGTGTNGHWYRVTTAGTVNFGAGNITFIVGDAVIYNGTVWQKDPAGAASTNLALGTITTTTIPVTNSNGSGFTIPSATTLLAGLLSAADKVKLDAAVTSETDPTVPAHVKSILSGDITNWNTAYSMRHAAVTLSGLGYITLAGQNLTIAAPTLQQVLTAGDTATGKDISLISVSGVGDLAVIDSVDSNIRSVLGAGYISLNANFILNGYAGYAQLGSGQHIRSTSDPVHVDDLARKAYVDASIASIPVFTPSALSRTNDTNITLTLGGTPATAMLQSVSITAGWSGTLAVSRGGSGAATLTGILVGNGTSAFTGVAGTANQLLRRNAANSAYEFFSPTYLTANQTITLSGDVTGSGTTAITATIANNAVTDAKLRNSVALSVIGRSANSTGAVADIVAATDGHVLRRSGTALGFGTIGDASISGLDWGKLTGLPSTFAPSPHTLDSHSNVTITSPSLNQYLGYNGSGWVNMTLPAGTVQNLSWSAGTGALSISGGTGANLDGRYFRIIRGHASNIDAVTSAGQGYWNPTTTDANSVLPGAYGMWVNFTALAETPGSGDWGMQFLIPSDTNRIRIRRLSAPSTWGVTSDLLTGHTGIATVNGIQQANSNYLGLDADTINPASVLHVEPVSNGPNSLTAGILQTFGGVERRYQFFTGPQGDNHYYRSRLTAAGGYGSWYQVASRSWVTTTLGSYATTASLSGYVNTTTNQASIAGWKGWEGNHTWIPESDNNATNNAIMFGFSPGNGPYIMLRNATTQMFVLRSYTTSGIQMSMVGGISAAAQVYSSGGYKYLVRNDTSGAFETRAIGIGDVTGLQAALDGKGAGTVTSVNITPPTGFTAGAAVTTSGNITLSYAAGYSLPTTAKQTAWDTSAARWFSINAPTGNDLNNATQGGVLYWSNTTANAPASTYGTVFTFVGASSTGDGAASNTWINQILASTGNDWYIRQSINNWSTWSTTYKIWTEKQFTSTSVSQWNTAYGWGAHTGLYVPLARTVSAGTGLSGGGALNSNQTLSFNTTWGDARYSQVGHSHATLNPGTGISGNGYNGSSTQTWSISFGSSAGQAAQGNDSRINNGQTAFGWGNHAGAGYVNSSRSFTGVNSIEGGGDFSTNRNFWLAGDVGSPGGNKYYGTNGGGSKGWWDLPSVSGYVPTNRIVSGAVSIQGGGDLNTNRYLQLVGDTTTPGPNRYYGTNGSETKGWWALPSAGVGGSGTNGYVPLWNSGSTLTSSVMVQSGGTIHIQGPLNVASSDAVIGNNLTVYGKAEVANGIFVGAHSTSSMNALSVNDGTICYNTTISEFCGKRSGTWYRLTRGAAI